MVKLSQNLLLSRCPHCSIANPLLTKVHSQTTNNHANTNQRVWHIYCCTSCGGIVSAYSTSAEKEIGEYFPSNPEIDEDLPDRAKAYLKQAVESLHAPAGAIMLAASSVDAMLKEKGYADGTLYTRIKEAAKKHLITPEMETWAHEVRLDANDQRHADENADLPSEDDARRVIDFTTALAQFLFVLPAKVQKGINPKKENDQ